MTEIKGTDAGVGGEKVVLGFSGGLDTSFCVKHFKEDKGYEVHSIIVNTGGFSPEIDGKSCACR